MENQNLRPTPSGCRVRRRAFSATAAAAVAGVAVGGLSSCSFCRRLWPFGRGGNPTGGDSPERDRAGAPFRVALLGGSIAYGKGVDRPDRDGLDARLAGALGDGFLVHRCARTDAAVQRGAERSVWDLGLLEQVAAFSPDVVVVLLGRADAKTKHWVARSRFSRDFDAVLAAVSGLPGEPGLVVCVPPPVFDGDGAIRSKLLDDGVAPAMRASARRADARIVDFHEDLAGRDDLFSDGVHPNARGTAVMARSIADAVEEVAGDRRR